MPPKWPAMVAAVDSPKSATPSQRREWRLKDDIRFKVEDVIGSFSEVESPEKTSAKRTFEDTVKEMETIAKKARPAESRKGNASWGQFPRRAHRRRS